MPSLFGIGGGSGGQGPSGSMNSAQLEMAVAELVSHPTKRCTSPILIFFVFSNGRLDMVTDVFNRLVACVNI